MLILDLIIYSSVTQTTTIFRITKLSRVIKLPYIHSSQLCVFYN